MIPVLHDLLVAIASLRFVAGAIAQSPAPASVDRRIVASQATLAETIARRRGTQSRVITFRQQGFPSGISLDRVTAQRQIAFHLPVSARVSRGHLELLVRFSPEVLPQSNLEVSVNGVLLAVVLRSDNGATTGKRVRVNLPADVLRGGWLVITMRAAVATTPDACLDERLGRGRVEVGAESFLAFDTPIESITSVSDAWTFMPETVTVVVPNRRLTAAEFSLAHKVSLLATRAARALRYATLPALGDVVIGTAREIMADNSVTLPSTDSTHIAVFGYVRGGESHSALALLPGAEMAATDLLSPTWAPIARSDAYQVRRALPTSRRADDDPTLADLGIADLGRNVGSDAEWHLPLDIRDFQPGRLPSSVDLELITAPNTLGRDLTVFAFLNGTLVRAHNVAGAGEVERFTVPLPSRFLTTRNDLRILITRQLQMSGGRCGQVIAPMPAQLLPTSRVRTKKADSNAPVFLSVTAALRRDSPVYLPDAALDSAAEYLPLLTALGRAFWNEHRLPTLTFYRDAAAPPTSSFLVIGTPRGGSIVGPVWTDSGRFRVRRRDAAEPFLDIRQVDQLTVAQVVTWNGQNGVQFRLASGVLTVPSAPESYDRADVMIAFGDSSVHRLDTGADDAELVINDGPSMLQRFNQDRWLWALLAVILLLPPAAWVVRMVWRRTPRRSFSRSARDTSKPK